jgi:hypothetical protein
VCRFIVVVVGFFAAIEVSPCQGPLDALDGYVTRAASPSDFDVNGFHVLLTGTTSIEQTTGNGPTSITADNMKLYIGLPVRVDGKLQGKAHAITATTIMLHQPEAGTVSSAGVIDGVLPASSAASSADDHLVRVDGYLLLIPAATATTFNAPVDGKSAFQVNVWVSFEGASRPDGVIVAAKASFSKNVISTGEDKLRSKREYDPTAVAPDAKQGALRKAFVGLDPKRIPPYNNSAMQARVSAIGATLVPKYQRDLPDTDESKINFRFQVIDQKKWPDAVALPSGIILVPHQVVERMQNDSQLATVLADNIATVLEKQDLRAQPALHAMRVEQLTGFGAGNSEELKELLLHEEEESGRVSLFLLHDAGYDILQAPLVWWALAGSKDIASTPLPERAGYIYKALGETWRVN